MFILLSLAFLQPAPPAGPWNLPALRETPRTAWSDTAGPLRRLYYESEPYRGHPTRVFAYYAEPTTFTGKLPGVVLIHGGGGKAFREWAELWAKRGYAALAMDLSGRGPDGQRLPDGGPEQDDGSKLPARAKPLNEIWSYHAVAAVIRGVSLLKSLPQVDGDKLAITGISWGGYLTCIVAGLDDRLKAAVPVYGCGFLTDNSAWLPRFAAMPADWRTEWRTQFDPASYLGRAKMPMLFVNGTNDFAYPLDSYQQSYRLVPKRTLCVTVNMPHGHPQGWAPQEIGLFIDQCLNGGRALLRLGETEVPAAGDGVAVLNVPQKATIRAAKLHYTADLNVPWQQRKWTTVEMPKQEGTDATDVFVAKVSKQRPLVVFITGTDDRGAVTSTEHRLFP